MSSLATQVNIVNMALVKLGQEPIVTLDDNNISARTAKLLWNNTRDLELSKQVWTFALKGIKLPKLDMQPVNYQNAYPLPADCLTLVQVGDEYFAPNLLNYVSDDMSLYRVEGNLILTDLSAPLKIRYIARVEDCTLYHPAFKEVLACKLAAEMCETIMQSNSKKQLALEQYKTALIDAVAANAIQIASMPFMSQSFVRTRL